MMTRRAWPTLAAVVLMGSSVIAQTTQPPATSEQKSDSEETTVTLVGCIQREADYRKAQDRGRGGVAGTGLGTGDEFVLINASRSATAPGALDCSSTSSAEAYELTGSREGDLKGFVGRAVQITGTLKQAEVKPVGTSGSSGAAAQPTGGFDPHNQDLKLFELNVTGFEEVGTLAQATPGAPVPAADARQAPPSAPPAAPVETGSPATRSASASAAAQPLPDTASPLPLTALLGVLALTGAVGLRRLQRRWS